MILIKSKSLWSSSFRWETMTWYLDWNQFEKKERKMNDCLEIQLTNIIFFCFCRTSTNQTVLRIWCVSNMKCCRFVLKKELLCFNRNLWLCILFILFFLALVRVSKLTHIIAKYYSPYYNIIYFGKKICTKI
jgi:hypothetical protein